MNRQRLVYALIGALSLVSNVAFAQPEQPCVGEGCPPAVPEPPGPRATVVVQVPGPGTPQATPPQVVAPQVVAPQVPPGQVYVQPPPPGALPYGVSPYGQPYGYPPYAMDPRLQQRYMMEQQRMAQRGQGRSASEAMIIAGSVGLGGSYLINLIVGLFAGYSSFAAEDWSDFRLISLIPLAGPWIQLGVKPTAIETDAWAQFLIIDGIIQLAGLGILIGGIALGEQGGAAPAAPADPTAPTVRLVPAFSSAFSGALLEGTF